MSMTSASGTGAGPAAGDSAAGDAAGDAVAGDAADERARVADGRATSRRSASALAASLSRAM